MIIFLHYRTNRNKYLNHACPYRRLLWTTVSQKIQYPIEETLPEKEPNHFMKEKIIPPVLWQNFHIYQGGKWAVGLLATLSISLYKKDLEGGGESPAFFTAGKYVQKVIVHTFVCGQRSNIEIGWNKLEIWNRKKIINVWNWIWWVHSCQIPPRI